MMIMMMMDSKRCRVSSVAELSDDFGKPIIWERTAGLSDRRPKNLDINFRNNKKKRNLISYH